MEEDERIEEAEQEPEVVEGVEDVTPDDEACLQVEEVVEGEIEERHCKKCGAVLHEGMNFCGACGTDNTPTTETTEIEKVAPEQPEADKPETRPEAEKPKAKLPKKAVPIAIAAVVLVAAVVAGVVFLPDMLATPKQLFEQQKYEKAFEKATEDEHTELIGLLVADGDFATTLQYANDTEKAEVLYTNLAAYLGKDVTSRLKNPHSYELRDMWVSGDVVIFEVQGTNSYGGSVSNYWYYSKDDDGSYEYMTCVYDLEQEDYSKYDSTYEKKQKLLDNLARLVIQKVISKSEWEAPKASITWTNDLFSSKQSFDDVDLLDDVSTLHAESDSTSTES